jgi:hypothetical protein
MMLEAVMRGKLMEIRLLDVHGKADSAVETSRWKESEVVEH